MCEFCLPCNSVLIHKWFFNDFHLYSKVFLPLDGGATYVDSDTGLESMSSAEATTKACSLCLDGVVASGGMLVPAEAGMQIDGLKQEVTRLKCDKLDLLRQNVVSNWDKSKITISRIELLPLDHIDHRIN